MDELEDAQSKGGWNFSLIFPRPEPLKTTFPLSNAGFHPDLFPWSSLLSETSHTRVVVCGYRKARDRLLLAELSDLGLDTLLLLIVGELLGAVLLGLGLPLLLGLLGSIAIGLLERVLTDGLVSLSVQVLDTISLDVVVDVLLELALVALLVVVGEGLHVLGDVATVDVLAESVGIELLGLDVETGETVLRVRHEDATVGGTLEGTEDTGTGGGTGQTDIKVGLEGAALAIIGLGSLGQGVLSISLLDTGEGLVDAELLEGTASDQETGRVGSSPVGQTVLDTVGAQLVGVGRDEDLVTADLGGDDLPVVTTTVSRLSQTCSLRRGGYTHRMMSRLVKRTTRRYLGALYLFLAWVIRRLRA